MKPPRFDYDRPASLAELLDTLARYGDDAKILAGGQSLVAAMNFRLARPSRLIDINRVGDLDFQRVEADRFVFGALTRHATFHRPAVDGTLGHLLRGVVANIAHFPIRQRGTFAGSLCHADPASEWCLVATTLDAELVIKGHSGERTEAASDFFRGTFTTTLQPDEVLAAVRLPLLGTEWRSGFCEFSRRKGDFALAMALAVLRLDGTVIQAARIGVGGIADKARRLTSLEARLVGQTPSDALFNDAAVDAAREIAPRGDIHGSADYRRDLLATMISRALHDAAADVGQPVARTAA